MVSKERIVFEAYPIVKTKKRDKSRAPKTTVRKAWLPAMVEIYHLQKRHPDAGGFRIWSLRGKSDLSVRTVERIMALNRRVYKCNGLQSKPARPAISVFLGPHYVHLSPWSGPDSPGFSGKISSP